MNTTILKRILAFYLDSFFALLITGMIFLIIYFLNPQLDLGYLGLPPWFFQLVVFLVYYFLLEFFFETTIAKRIFKLKIVEKKAGQNKFLTYSLRTIARLIPFDFISIVITSKGDMLHDIISNTQVVVKEK